MGKKLNSMSFKKKDISIAIIGLGYVGLPLALEFSKKFNVIGYDTNKKRIKELINGFDKTLEVDSEDLKSQVRLKFTSNKESIADINVYIVTVPTPVDKNNTPNLKPLEKASEEIALFLSKGDHVIYESTVYPGATEEICVPLLEKGSKLKYNLDFFCGYSPERINPGDKNHKLKSIKKITSGSNRETAIFVKKLYDTIIDAGTYSATSIKVAEAAKVIENTQRDVNIALVNELALIFDKLEIRTSDVLSAAETKWNFLPFKPGLVGGHCIGVDPYYLTHKSVEVGYYPEMILSGRKINNSMGKFIAEKTILKLISRGVDPIGSKIGILGLTFKENCPDLRNTKVTSIIEKLTYYKADLFISDDYADKKEAKEVYNIDLVSLSNLSKLDAVILAVSHDKYRSLNESDWSKMLSHKGLIIDLKSIVDPNVIKGTEYDYWSL